MADCGFKLDELVHDKEVSVRMAVANKGYGLDILINDASEDVRERVARQGYGLDKLINDDSHFVRCAVANQGYGLNKLKDDEKFFVRKTVAIFCKENNLNINNLPKENCVLVDKDVWKPNKAKEKKKDKNIEIEG